MTGTDVHSTVIAWLTEHTYHDPGVTIEAVDGFSVEVTDAGMYLNGDTRDREVTLFVEYTVVRNTGGPGWYGPVRTREVAGFTDFAMYSVADLLNVLVGAPTRY